MNTAGFVGSMSKRRWPIWVVAVWVAAAGARAGLAQEFSVEAQELQSEGAELDKSSLTSPEARAIEEQNWANPGGGIAGDPNNLLFPLSQGTWTLVNFCSSNCQGNRPATPPDCHANDDDTAAVTLPFTFRLFGDAYTACNISNNGNINFGTCNAAFSSTGFPAGGGVAMVAPFWADVDTGTAQAPIGRVWMRTVGNNTLVVTWDNVGYYNQQSNLLNTFQVAISDGTNPIMGIGNNVCFSYSDMQWTTGSASGGIGGFGGTPATVGVNRGNGVQFAQVGRFNQDNSNYDGPGDADDGVNYLDNQRFCFDARTANICPIPQNFPLNNTLTVNALDTLDYDVQFSSPELDQITSVTIADLNGAQQAGLVITNTPGDLANVHLHWAAECRDAGTYVLNLNASDNFNPPCTVHRSLTIIVAYSPPVCQANGYFGPCDGATTTVQLDGREARDPDGDIFDYTWTSDCPGVSFDDIHSARPHVTVNTGPRCCMSCTATLTISDSCATLSCTTGLYFANVPGPFSLLSPVDPSGQCVQDVSTAATFDWSDSTDALSYELQIDDNYDFSSPVVIAQTTVDPMPPLPSGSQLTLPPGTLSSGTLYYWRVIAHRCFGMPPSEVVSTPAFQCFQTSPELPDPFETCAAARWQQASAFGPPPRTQHAMALDADRLVTVVFGGLVQNGAANSNETWELAGNSWSLRANTGPSARYGAAMAYDPLRHKMVLFGGFDNTLGIMTETWELVTFGGSPGWVRVSASSPLGGRLGAKMVYDNARQRIVLFGGTTGMSPPNTEPSDTWEWDGATWTRRAVVGPAGRTAHGMAFDSSRGRVVLYGGVADGGIYVQDTWEWDGTLWTNRGVSGPGLRGGQAMAYNFDSQRCVLFGGVNDTGLALRDTWEWDGASWRQTGSVGPSARAGHGLVYQPDDGFGARMVIFGGTGQAPTPNSGAQQLNDTWRRGQCETPVRFADDAFRPVDWTSIRLVPGVGFQYPLLTTGQTMAAGTVAPSMFVRHTMINPGSIIAVHMRTGATYDPATQGPIGSIDVSYDLLRAASSGGEMAFFHVIQQNDAYYLAAYAVTRSASEWRHILRNGLDRNAYVRFAGTGPDNPDFSAGGVPMQFGFGTSNSVNGPLTIEAMIDNWSMTIRPPARPTNWYDGNFDDVDWPAPVIIDMTITHNAAATVNRQATGGNPGAWRYVQHAFSGGVMYAAHMRRDAIYSPALRGAIDTIDFSYDCRTVNPPAPEAAIGYGLVLRQNDTYYSGGGTAVVGTGWQHFNFPALHASQFGRFAGNGPANPDFSANAAPIYVGYVSWNASGDPNDPRIYYMDGGIDNWNVTINPVANAPQIQLQPSGRVGTLGRTATFSVSASGGGTLAYHWRKDGVNLTDGARISGATSATLTIHPLMTADAGQYDVVVSNAGGSVTSAVARLTVFRAGDLNCDGAVNNFDIDPFVLSLTNPAAYDAAFPSCARTLGDMNADGAVNNFDIDAFVACLVNGGCP